MRLKLISCEVFFREMATTISRSANEIEVQFLPRALHRLGCARMRQALEHALSQVDESRFQAVLFAYGLCHRGVVGLRAHRLPLVFPRAKNCARLSGDPRRADCGLARDLTLPHRHNGIVSRHATGESAAPVGRHRSPAARPSSRTGRSGLVPDYGPELDGPRGDCLDAASRESPLGAADYLESQASHEAAWFGWDFELGASHVPLLQRLLDGFWSHHEFLVVPPGYQVVAATGEQVIAAEEVQP